PVPSTQLLSSPQILNKPDFAATDCTQNSFFPPPPQAQTVPHRFCGTSEAAPHAAAVAALMKRCVPAASPADIGAALKSTARAVGSFGQLAVGSGLIDANAAVG